VKTVQSAVEGLCCIDSPDPKAIEAALAVHKGTAMINSISLEKDRYESLLPVVAGTDLKVVALCMSDAGMPETADDRMAIADKLVNSLLQKNVAIDNIYVDPLVQPVSTNIQFGVEFMNAIEKIMTTFKGVHTLCGLSNISFGLPNRQFINQTTFKGVHTLCGLSNISFGLPNRQFINQTFMSMAIAKGLDSAIINPLDKKRNISKPIVRIYLT
jgi:5-methyltetrahydrofolate--homocysteine methyltransferase